MMKYKLLIPILFVLTAYFYPQNIKDTFSIVTIKVNENALMYELPDNNSKIIAKIPPDTINIRSTWKTKNSGNTSWIEIIYRNNKGWVKRKDLTRTFGTYSKKEKDKIIDLLIILTKSLQQKDNKLFNTLFYSLRGFFIYNTHSKNLETFGYPDIIKLWEKINATNKNLPKDENQKYFGDIQKILESDFNIEYNKDLQNIQNIPSEIINFDYVLLKCKYDERLNDISLYIGIEFWNNKPFISSIIIEN